MSDVVRTAGQAQTFPYVIRDASNNLLTPAANPTLTVHASSADAASGANPLNTQTLSGAAGAYLGTVPVGLAAGTYYLRFVSSILTDVDDRLVLQAATGSVSSALPAALPTALVSLADIKLQLGLPAAPGAQDVELQINIDMATDLIEGIKGPVIPRLYTAEKHHGRSRFLSLDRRPVMAVASVTEYVGVTAYPLTIVTDPSQATSFSCLLDLDTGSLTRLTGGGVAIDFARGEDNIHVTYTAGRATVPPAVRGAAMRLVQWWWQSTQQGARPQFQGGQGGAPKGPLPAYAVPNFVYHLLEAGDGVRIPGIA